MSTQLTLELIRGIGLAIGIGLTCLIIPFGLLVLADMLPWYVAKASKLPCCKRKIRKEALNDSSYDKQVYIDYCHPSQVIKRLRDYGLQSLFWDRRFTEYPVEKPNSFCNKGAPKNLLN